MDADTVHISMMRRVGDSESYPDSSFIALAEYVFANMQPSVERTEIIRKLAKASFLFIKHKNGES